MRRARIPSYSVHKASGQARVCIDGRDIYLGVYDSPESRAEYARQIDKWQLRQKARRCPSLSVGQLVLLYDEHAKGYYVKGDRQTSEYGLVKLAMRPLVKLYTHHQVADFGPRDLKRVRDDMVKEKMSRTTVNGFTRRIVQMFRWAVSEEYCPAEVAAALAMLPGLRKGRSAARETKPVKPIDEATVNATLPHVPKRVGDMIRLQLLTGCRPGEIVAIRPCDVIREGDAWEYVPADHKTDHHGKQRRIFIGPKAQAILAPYLDNRPAEAFCFSPAEADEERRAEAHAARKTPLSCGNRPGTNRKGNPAFKLGVHYRVNTYMRAIHRGCDDAKIPRWSPNRLRHSRATDLRKQYGVEMTRTVLGHSNVGTSEIYAERDFEQARAIMAEVG